jgi:nitrite reductase/ring-hydroxylating ferredoxin subunit
LFAVRRGGQVYVYINRCPHRGVGLEWTNSSTPVTA